MKLLIVISSKFLNRSTLRQAEFSLVIMAMLVLASCQVKSLYNPGTGPITLSPKTAASFEMWKTRSHPTYFSVAKDGKGWSSGFCKSDGYQCKDDWGQSSVARCNKQALLRGSSCAVFSRHGDIVWKGPVSFGKTQGDYLFTITVNQGTSELTTAGSANHVNKQMIRLILGACSGQANLGTKKWFLKNCKNGRSASGTFVAGKGAERYFGIGTESSGRSVEIKLLMPVENEDPKTSDENRDSTNSSSPLEAVKDRLQKIKDLLEKGLISPEEAEKKRKEILENL